MSREQIHQYLMGNLGEESVEELNRVLEEDAEARQEFVLAANVDAALRDASIERAIDQVQGRLQPFGARSKFNPIASTAALVAVAALGLAAIGLWTPQPALIATIVSSEEAAWESALPTSPGSDLSIGVLNLKAGIATIEFRSGAEITVEAPAQLQLISKMRARLNWGAAVMNVPDSAIGFTLETPEGYAVDFGTRFAVRIDRNREVSDFELIEGEIEVHGALSGESVRLDEAGATASVSIDSLLVTEEPMLEEGAMTSDAPKRRVIRLTTQGRCGTALYNERRRKKAVRPGYLYASHTNNGKWDMRSFFEFDLAAVDLGGLATAKLRLNQVHSYRGSASLLPKVNRFAVYAMTNAAKEGWNVEPSWAESPSSLDGTLIGSFAIPRSRMRGAIEIETAELRSFLKRRGDRPVTFILVRETGRIDGVGPAMPHMFASDKHPEAVGPMLELTVE